MPCHVATKPQKSLCRAHDISSSHKGTGHTAFGPTLWTSSYLMTPAKTPFANKVSFRDTRGQDFIYLVVRGMQLNS